MTKVVWLPNETDYSYCEFVAPNTPYCEAFYAQGVKVHHSMATHVGVNVTIVEPI